VLVMAVCDPMASPVVIDGVVDSMDPCKSPSCRLSKLSWSLLLLRGYWLYFVVQMGICRRIYLEICLSMRP
jgi:hypothetical protein